MNAPTSPVRARRRPRALALAAGACAALALAAIPPAGAQENAGTRAFSIPNAHLTQVAQEIAAGFVASESWPEAVRELQGLIDDHRGKVLDGQREDRLGRMSGELLHTGASHWATSTLFERASELGTAYRERFAGEAAAALASALATMDRDELVGIARRWPLTEAAIEAWWTVGDLELERGSITDAVAAWRRAERWSAVVAGDELPAGAAARLALAADAERGTGVLGRIAAGRAPAGFLALPGPGEGATDLPRYDAHSWTAALDRTAEQNYLPSTLGGSVFFPIVSGDTLYVSTGLELFAFDAFSGERSWRSGQPAGWKAVPNVERNGLVRNDFFEAVDKECLMLAPAIADGVAVCALQIPVTHSRSQVFQGQYQITYVNPDRRLFAFDAASGAPLWDHYPPADWDGERGAFAERMSVAGPPVIRGSRVYVPMYRLQGRVDYHAACFDLTSGDLLWSVALISGQRELNMFGRHVSEFSAPPLVLSGDRVLALTQLGAVAAVDAFTGDLLWQTFYDQIELPTNLQFHQRRRERFWENAPPIVAGEIAIATPIDSPDMIAVDIETGTLRWARSFSSIVPRTHRLQGPQALLGCDANRVYVGGDPLFVGEAVSGLASGLPPSLPFAASGSSRTSDSPARARAALGQRFAVVPLREQRLAIDRDDPQRGPAELHTAAWRSGEGPGNLLLADGALFVCTGSEVHGYFEWSALENRLAAQVADRPHDAALAERYASLYFHRGEEHWHGGRSADALRDLSRAREILEQRPLAAAEAPREDRDDALAAARLFRTLRAEAHVLGELADRGGALDRLGRAARLAPSRAELARVLLQEEALLAPRGGQAWEAVLIELDEQCGDLALPTALDPFGGTAGSDSSDSLGRPSRAPHDGSGGPGAGQSIGLWTLQQRAERYAKTQRVADEFAVLHEILARYGDIDGDSAAVSGTRSAGGTRSIRDRIATLLAQGNGGAHEPFERQAQELLHDATAAGDQEALERVVALYPHSAAAGRASLALLDAAAALGDVGRIVAIVRQSLAADWLSRPVDDEAAGLLLRLAAALERSNPAAAQGLIVRLATQRPDLVVDLPPFGATSIAELAERSLPTYPRPRVSETSTFTVEELEYGPAYTGRFELLGSLFVPATSGGTEATITIARRIERPELLGFSSAFPGEPLWSFDLVGRLRSHYRFDGRYALTDGRIVLATEEELLALDAASGELHWSARDENVYYESLAVADGVLVASLSTEDGIEVVALDVVEGIELWRRALPDDYLPEVEAGDGWAAFLSVRFGRALVLDLFTGAIALEFSVGESRPEGKDAGAAWIANGALVLPSFSGRLGSREYWVLAYDLATGERTWRVPSQAGRHFEFIAYGDDADYLIALPAQSGVDGAIIELDTRLGATRTVPGVRLALDDIPIGLVRYGRVELASPLLFIQSSSPRSEHVELRALQLPYGERWTHTLDVTFDEVYNDPWPQPAVSRDTVTIAFSAASHTRANQPHLLLLDRHSGKFLDRILLPASMGGAGLLELMPLGDALLVASSRSQLQVLGRYR